jgi:prophage regulatory protein
MRESQNPQGAKHSKAAPVAATESVREGDVARILRFKQVAALVGLGKSSIYRKVQEGTFPKPIKLGSARASGWISTEVYDWIDDQIRRSRKAA